MPRVYRSLRRRRRRTIRRTYRRKTVAVRRRRYGRNMLTRSLNPAKQMPHIWKMRYNTSKTLASGATAGTTEFYAFRANGLFDPDTGTGGHQPMLHDQLANFWEKYCVLGSKITVKVVGSNATAYTAYLGVLLDDDANLLAVNPSALIENAKGPYKIINSGANTSLRSTSVVAKFSAKKFFSKRNVLDDDTIGAPFGNDPANQAYFLVWLNTGEFSSQNSVALNVDITIDYIVYCSEPKDIAQS